MVKPREIVFRLNAGGDDTARGDVPPDAAAGVVPPVVGVVVGVVAVVVPLGATSGEKIVPSAYEVRLTPYVFARDRSTSRISTSTTISARGLSFCSMIFSRICTTELVPRTVSVLVVRFGAIAGCTAMPGRRMIVLRICDISVASACDR